MYPWHSSCEAKATGRQHMKSIRTARGFTLVEIAIVLVIIGLLLGGILKGQEMITQAKIKNVIAGFVSGVGDQQPFNALTGMIGVQTGDTANGPVLGADGAGTGGLSGLIICSANLPDKIAIAADTQMDDGVPVAGSVRGQLQGPINPAVAKQAAPNYAETGTNVYVICRAL